MLSSRLRRFAGRVPQAQASVRWAAVRSALPRHGSKPSAGFGFLLLVVLGAWSAGCSSREDVLGAPDETTAANQPGPGGDTFPGESCSGCARLEVPLSAGDQLAVFQLSFPEPVDMTDTTVTWRLKAVGFSGTSGRVGPFVRDAQNGEQCLLWTELSSLAAWTNVTCELAERTPGAAGASFDRTQVVEIGVQIHGGGVSAAAVYDEALVYVDSITFSDHAAPDITFDAGVGDLHLVLESSASAPPGTNVAFLGP
jgi:hypothetical protein